MFPQIVALANLLPIDDSVDELDSYMYQTVRFCFFVFVFNASIGVIELLLSRIGVYVNLVNVL